jgi:hypothetical protein
MTVKADDRFRSHTWKIGDFLSLSPVNHHMSAQNIPLGLPNPFYQQPPYVAAPITGIVHVPATQLLTSGAAQPLASGQLTAAQCLCPFILNMANANTGAFVLPDAFTLSQAYGNSQIPVVISNQINGFSILPSNQVQPGDVFTIPIEQLSSSTANPTTWLAGTGASGFHLTSSYAVGGNQDALVIQFTAVGPSLAYCAYTLQ